MVCAGLAFSIPAALEMQGGSRAFRTSSSNSRASPSPAAPIRSRRSRSIFCPCESLEAVPGGRFLTRLRRRTVCRGANSTPILPSSEPSRGVRHPSPLDGHTPLNMAFRIEVLPNAPGSPVMTLIPGEKFIRRYFQHPTFSSVRLLIRGMIWIGAFIWVDSSASEASRRYYSTRGYFTCNATI